MSVYKGTFNNRDWYTVTKDGETFDPAPSQKIRNHSPDGFSWGYIGSGPTQLALGILLDVFGPKIAEAEFRLFTFQVIAALPRNEFTLTTEQVQEWVNTH